MTEWIRKRELITNVNYSRAFHYVSEPGRGFSFPCDEQGTLDSIPDMARANFEACLTGTVDGEAIIDDGIERWVNEYWEAGVIRCVCGAEVALWHTMTNTCEKCERDYNVSGQLLAPRSQWGWDTGESLSDILMADRDINDRDWDEMDYDA